ncbi:MAG: YicC/YloC family endoribonuclease [Eubacteriaceae bacterium]
MRSMTGFGRGEYRDDNYEIIVEMKSINHRYKDFFIRLPRQISMIEENIRKFVSEEIIRGRIEINVKMDRFKIKEKSLDLNYNLAEDYVKCLTNIKEYFPSLAGDVSLSLVSRFPDVIITQEEDIDFNLIWEKIKPALKEAIDNILISRKNEGLNLKKDFIKRLNYLNDYLNIIIDQAPKVTEDYKKKLEDRIKEFTNSIEVDENRLLTEVAYYSDRVNITEEITRLQSHLDRFFAILDEDDAIGRKLDFLIQEMNREINTIGSKANDIQISNCVVDMKSELEKMREQIQNIE